MKERDFQKLFNLKNKILGTFELKMVKLKSFAFKGLREHQQIALLQSEHGISVRIQDEPFSKTRRFTTRKQFDCLRLKEQGFVVLMWYVPYKKKAVYYLKIQDLLKMQKNNSPRKSMTEKEAIKIASYMENY